MGDLKTWLRRKWQTLYVRWIRPHWAPWVFVGTFLFSIVVGFLPILVVGLDDERAARWGSSFGFVAAIMSGLAFAGVIVTLRYQRKELALQRRELRESRLQYERMAQAQEGSDKRLFLTSYLNAIDSLRELHSQSPRWDHDMTLPAVRRGIYTDSMRRRLGELLPILDGELKALYPEAPARYEQPTENLELLLHLVDKLDLVIRDGRDSDDKRQVHEAHDVIRYTKDYIPTVAGEVRPEVQRFLRLCDKHLNAAMEQIGSDFDTFDKTRLWGAMNQARDSLKGAIVEYYI